MPEKPKQRNVSLSEFFLTALDPSKIWYRPNRERLSRSLTDLIAYYQPSTCSHTVVHSQTLAFQNEISLGVLCLFNWHLVFVPDMCAVDWLRRVDGLPRYPFPAS